MTVLLPEVKYKVILLKSQVYFRFEQYVADKEPLLILSAKPKKQGKMREKKHFTQETQINRKNRKIGHFFNETIPHLYLLGNSSRRDLPHLPNRATKRIHFRNGKIFYRASKQQRILLRARRKSKWEYGITSARCFFITSVHRQFQ